MAKIAYPLNSGRRGRSKPLPYRHNYSLFVIHYSSFIIHFEHLPLFQPMLRARHNAAVYVQSYGVFLTFIYRAARVILYININNIIYLKKHT